MSIFIKPKMVRTMEGSLQQFAKRIRTNIKQDDEDYKQGKVGAGMRNPFRKNAAAAPQIDTVAERARLQAKRQKK